VLKEKKQDVERREQGSGQGGGEALDVFLKGRSFSVKLLDGWESLRGLRGKEVLSKNEGIL